MDWATFLAENEGRLESQFEVVFVRNVLARVPGLDFADVQCQTGFNDSSGVRRRIDFTIMLPEGARIALEVDGWDKTGRGLGMTRTEFVAWSRRELDLTSQGWTVLRFANSLVTREPTTCARHVELTLARERAARHAAEGAPEDAGEAWSAGAAAELARLEAVRLKALGELEDRLAAVEGENQRMKSVAWAFAVTVVAVSLLAFGIIYFLDGRADPAPPPEAGGATSDTSTRLSFCPNAVSWSGARQHLGRRASVQGPVVEASYRPSSRKLPPRTGVFGHVTR